jgi:DNA polymerase-3 subunit beta
VNKVRVVCERERVVQKLQQALPFAGKLASPPITTGYLLEARDNCLVIKSTDLVTFFGTYLDCNVLVDGECVVNAKLLLGILKDMEGESVAMEAKKNILAIKDTSSHFQLHTMPIEDYPAEPAAGDLVADGIPADTLADALEKVARAAAKTGARYELMGVYVDIREDGITLVGTDSYRLSLVRLIGDYGVSREWTCIISAPAVHGLSRLPTEGRVCYLYGGPGSSYLTLDMEDTYLRTRLVEGKYPKYEQFIPESVTKEVLAGKKRLLSALRRVTHIGSTVKIELEENRMRLSTLSKDVGEAWEEVPVEYKGESITIAFNGKFLEDGISSVEGEKVYIGLTEPLKPAVIKEEGSDAFLYLVMPVRL